MSFNLKELNKKLGKFRFDQKGKTLVIIAVSVLVLGGTLLALILTSPEPVQPEEPVSSHGQDERVEAAIPLITRAESDVASIYIKNKFCEVTFEKNEAGSFRMREHPKLGLTDQFITFIWEDAYSLGALVEVVPEEGIDSAALYGLNDPAAEARVSYKNGETSEYIIGGEVPGQADTYYIKLDGSDKIYAAWIHGSYFNELSYYCTLALQDSPKNEDGTYKTASVDAVNLSGNGLPGDIMVYMNPGKEDPKHEYYGYAYLIEMADKSVYPADETNCDRLFYQFSTISANKALIVSPTQEQKKAHGLDVPKGKATYVFTADGESSTHTVYLGDSSGVFTYIMFDDIDVLYQISTTELYDSINPNINELRSKFILGFAIESVKAMTFTFEDESYRFEVNRTARDNAAETVFYDYQAIFQGKEISFDYYRDFFQTVISTESVSYDNTAVQNGKTPLTIRVEYFDDTGKADSVVTFTESTGVRQYMCKIDGKGDMSVSEAVINRIKKNAKNLSENKAIINY